MMMDTKKFLKFGMCALAGAVVGAFFAASAASALVIEDTGLEDNGAFSIQPAKLEVNLDPGEEKKVELEVINRTGATRLFKIVVEDFKGSRDPNTTTVLLGDERGPYSLKDYVLPEVSEFEIETGKKAVVSIAIKIPEDAEPGGLYGTALITSLSGRDATPLITRAGALFFVRVNGEVRESGRLTEFAAKGEKSVYFDKGPDQFSLLFENDGSVHLNPYGEIVIKNSLGVTVDEIEVAPYFAMPDSIRLREVQWNRNILLGRYTAVAKINRGYDDIVDELSVSFWVLPLGMIVGGFAAIVFFVLVLKWLALNYRLVRKRRK